MICDIFNAVLKKINIVLITLLVRVEKSKHKLNIQISELKEDIAKIIFWATEKDGHFPVEEKLLTLLEDEEMHDVT